MGGGAGGGVGVGRVRTCLPEFGASQEGSQPRSRGRSFSVCKMVVSKEHLQAKGLV